MGTFAVEIREISEVLNHPNADRLDLCKVEGMEFQFVTGRDEYKPGDKVVYFDNNHLNNAGAALVAPLFRPVFERGGG